MRHHDPDEAGGPLTTVRDGGFAPEPAPTPRTTRDPGADPAPRTSLDGRTPPAAGATPGTTRDPAGGATPGTTRDPSGQAVPGTTRDASGPGAPGTTRDPSGRVVAAPAPPGPADAPGTTRDAPASSGSPAPPAAVPTRHRVNLPAALVPHYTLEKVLGAGGEADLLLARKNGSGDLVVVRRYREDTAGPDEALLERLETADRRHLIGVLDWRKDDEAAWEVLEYAPHGSFADLCRVDPAPWPPGRVDQALGQLTDALAYVHSLGMVHRDVKPQNVLVRSVQPLDMVLTDFGLTRLVAGTQVMATTSRTAAYAAPEAAAGAISSRLDWWSLGMLVAELLTGRHPFRRPDGGWLSDMQILNFLLTHEVPLDGIGDERWRDLCRGLLTRDPHRRWTAAEVGRWRAGERPEVHLAPDPGATSGRRADRPLVFRGAALFGPAEAAAAFRAHWPEAVRLLHGREFNAPGYLALCDWVAELELPRAARILDRTGPPDRVLTQLLLVLDPEAEPCYRGWSVSRSGLPALVRAAATDATAAGVVDALYAEGVLDAVDGAPDSAGLGLVNERWRQLAGAMERHLPPGYRELLGPERMRLSRIRLLAAALAPDRPAPAAAEAAAARADPRALQQGWFRWLAELRLRADQPAADELVVQLRDLAAEQTGRQVAQQARNATVAAEQEAAQRRRRTDERSAAISFVCMLIALTPLGLATGPAAVYFGIRAQRSSRPGCLGASGLIFGALLTALWVAAVLADLRVF